MQQEIEDIKPFIITLREGSGYDFSNYSIHAIKRRLRKILNEFRITFEDLVKKISHDALFREEIVKKLTVHTTELFRDPPLWLQLKESILPKYLPGKTLSIWHAGCSSGEEVYSMMMLLHRLGLLHTSHILATDINQDVLNIARIGRYQNPYGSNYLENFNKVINIGMEDPWIHYSSYFEINSTCDQIQMKDLLLQKPKFHKMDLAAENNAFEQKFDIIVCRNVLFYFNQELQNKVLNLLCRNMNENAFLILGFHENISGPGASVFDRKGYIYHKKQKINCF